jgi:3-oxoadipate enol-lactonase
MARLAHRFDGLEGAPVLVLSGSLGTTAAVWARQLDAFARRFRVLRYDHRGHGGSEVPGGPYDVPGLAGDVVALLDQLELERVSFCGLSLGGAVGLTLAVDFPERLERLVLACAAGRFLDEVAWRDRAALVRREGTAAIADGTLTRWFTPGFREREPAVVDEIRTQILATPREGYAACCDALATWDYRDRLGDVRAPALVLAGAEDPGRDGTEALAEAIGTRPVVLEDAAHLANVEQPDRFNAVVLDNLEAM